MRSRAFQVDDFLGKKMTFAGFLWWVAILLLMGSCASDLDFRQFEVGEVAPRVVLDTAVEVVKDFYTNVHGGVTLFVNEDNWSFETDYVQKRTALDEDQGKNQVSISMEPLKRQKLFFRVLVPSDPSEGVRVEILATYEILSFDDPEALKNPDDLWTFVKQDTQMEDLIFEQLLQRLVEKELID
ncbi:MAG: hypothetical protein ABIK28_11325 [Planctomycetota bacterium]